MEGFLFLLGNKYDFYYICGYLYYMGRLKKTEEEKKIKIGISIDRKLFNQLKKDKIVPSRFFDKQLKEYYGKKDL